MALHDNICCPHCGEKLSVEVASKMMDSSRVRFVLHPNKDELLSARTVGGSIEQMEKLLVACGKEAGVRTAVLVEGISFDDGSVTVSLLVTRQDGKVQKRQAAESTPERP